MKKKVVRAIATRCFVLALAASLICLPAFTAPSASAREIPPADRPEPGSLPAVTMGETGLDTESWISSFAVYLEQCGIERGKEFAKTLTETGFRARVLEDLYMYRSARLGNLEVFLEIRDSGSPEMVAFVVMPTPELGDMTAGQRERALANFALVMRACVFANISELGEAENEPQKDAVDALCPGGLEVLLKANQDVEANFARTGRGAEITEDYWLYFDAEMAFLTFGEASSLNAPFARNMDTGDTISLGMSRGQTEAIIGMPVKEDPFGKQMFIYEGITVAYRDDLVVYIRMEDKQWAANGVATADMSVEEAARSLGMSFEGEHGPYTLGYFQDGTKRQMHPNPSPEGDADYLWALTLMGNDTVGRIVMGDKQYLTTLR